MLLDWLKVMYEDIVRMLSVKFGSLSRSVWTKRISRHQQKALKQHANSTLQQTAGSSEYSAVLITSFPLHKTILYIFPLNSLYDQSGVTSYKFNSA